MFFMGGFSVDLEYVTQYKIQKKKEEVKTHQSKYVQFNKYGQFNKRSYNNIMHISHEFVAYIVLHT